MDLVIISNAMGAWEFVLDASEIEHISDPMRSKYVGKTNTRTVTAESAREDYGVKIPGFINKRG